MDRPRLGISRCLLGDEVRYDGGHRRDSNVIDMLGPYVEWVSVCPEVEVGMGTPREPIHLVAASDGVPSADHRVRLVGVTSGRDWTDAMDRWQRDRVGELERANLCGFVLKKNSPSCGPDNVAVVTANDIAREGRGLFAQALIEALPDLPIEDEERLHDRAHRERFMERVLARHEALRKQCLPNRG